MRAHINILNCDCMDWMKDKPDNYYDLSICDPPYGIGCDGNKASTGGHGGRKEHMEKNWDNKIPEKTYFDELFRISKNQIIFGANYYPQFLKGSMGWVVWDKGQRISQSDGELMFTSFQRALRILTLNRVELLRQGGTIHPTEKPIYIYKWLLNNYAKEGDTILDTHLGSGSIAIACWELGFDLDGCELDKDYYDAAVRRFKNFKSQGLLF